MKRHDFAKAVLGPSQKMTRFPIGQAAMPNFKDMICGRMMAPVPISKATNATGKLKYKNRLEVFIL